MARDPIVFALANPVPEVQPEALVGIARVIVTGRSDYRNQINSSLGSQAYSEAQWTWRQPTSTSR